MLITINSLSDSGNFQTCFSLPLKFIQFPVPLLIQLNCISLFTFSLLAVQNKPIFSSERKLKTDSPFHTNYYHDSKIDLDERYSFKANV